MNAQRPPAAHRCRTARPTGRLAGLLAVLLLGCALALPRPALAFTHGEFIVFPNINSVYRDQEIALGAEHDLPEDRTTPTVDFFYSRDFQRLRLLGEFFVSSAEDRGSHFERLQLGWQLREDGVAWAGRFHNPLGYWNTQYHHGNYLETSITRPGIAAYEHDGGVLPMHLVGLLWQGGLKKGEQRYGLDLAVGLAPQLRGETLHALDILDLQNDHESAATLRLSYQPLEDGPEQYGLFLARGTLFSRALQDVEQNIAGLYGHWEGRLRRHDLRLLGALFQVATDPGLAGLPSRRFSSAYLQLEAPFARRWTLFLRAEDNYGDRDVAYLDALPAYVRARQLGGLRFEFSERQALKLEVSHARYLERSSDQVRIQWSAVIP